MDKTTRKIILFALIVLGLAVGGYIAYQIYEYVASDITTRVRKGVSEGIGEGVGGMLNPVTLPARLLGGGKSAQ